VSVDKFLTDLAGCTGATSIVILWDTFTDPDESFEVRIYRLGGKSAYATGPTVEAAMLSARAKLKEAGHD